MICAGMVDSGSVSFMRWSGFQLSVESNQAITWVLVLVLLIGLRLAELIQLVSSWFGFGFTALN